MMKHSKIYSLKEAIARFVPDGCSVVMGSAQETLIPFAAGHEIIRQRKRQLTMIGPISDILFDQLVGAGCVSQIRAAWVGNVITGSAYNFRRAVETGEIKVEDHSNLTLSMALRAGALGVPFLPTYTARGSDLFKTNANLKTVACPFTGQALTAVAAINPDVTIIHVQRSDELGNAHSWGNTGITREACLAAKRIVITCEEIVSPHVISSDPNRVITPGFRVNAVVHAPWGAHPSPVPGYYNRDHQAFLDYREDSLTPKKFSEWIDHWVDGVRDPSEYIDLLGGERMGQLAIKRHAPSAIVDYGY
jgi:glutaconate CoA-transferase, subunit A